jgi:hypothetical protein
MRRHLRNTALVLCCWLPTSLGAAERGPSAASDAKVTEPAATPPWWIAAELHVSLLSNLVEKSTVNLAFGVAAKAGYRWKNDWGAYFLVEHDAWVETEIATDVKQGVLNLGFGAERLFLSAAHAQRLEHRALHLAVRHALDDAGTTGLTWTYVQPAFAGGRQGLHAGARPAHVTDRGAGAWAAFRWCRSSTARCSGSSMGWGAEMGSTLSSAAARARGGLCTESRPHEPLPCEIGLHRGLPRAHHAGRLCPGAHPNAAELALYVPDGPWKRSPTTLLRDANFQPASRAEKFSWFTPADRPCARGQ